MIAVDTNVLLRLLVGDDAAQALKSRQLFDGQDEAGATVWVGDTVLVEFAWTLSRAYGRSRDEVASALRALTQHATVTLESPRSVREALDLYASTAADFADCLLCAKAAAAGCGGVATFDRGMKRLPGVLVL